MKSNFRVRPDTDSGIVVCKNPVARTIFPLLTLSPPSGSRITDDELKTPGKGSLQPNFMWIYKLTVEEGWEAHKSEELCVKNIETDSCRGWKKYFSLYR